MELSNSLDMALQERVAEVAYELAEARGFAPGHALDDWLQAEAVVASEIRQRLEAATIAPVLQETPVPELQPAAAAPAGQAVQ